MLRLWLRASAALMVMCVGVLVMILVVLRSTPVRVYPVFVTNENGRVVALDFDRNFTSELFRNVRLTVSTYPPSIHSHFNGQRIAYGTWVMGASGTMVFDIEGNLSYQTARSSEDRGTTMSPTGEHIAFWSNRASTDFTSQQSRNWHMHIFNFDTSQPFRVSPEIPLTTTDDIYWSPDGKRLLFLFDQSTGRRGQIYDLETSTLTDVTGIYTLSSPPAWSPDGQYIFHTHLGMNGYMNSEYILSTETDLSMEIEDNCLQGEEYFWSPVKRGIIFSCTKRGITNLFRFDRIVRDVAQLTPKDGVNPVISSDGEHLLFEAISGDQLSHLDIIPVINYRIMNLDTKVTLNLLESRFYRFIGWYIPDD